MLKKIWRDSLNSGRFAKDTVFTTVTDILTLVLGLTTSIILARLLGPNGKGIYTMATLFPSLIITFIHLGIGPATVYYTAQRRYPQREVFGSNVVLALIIGTIGLIIGLPIIFFFRNSLLPNITYEYLLIALGIIPLNLLFSYLRYMLLGVQRIKEYNIVSISQSLFFLIILSLLLWGLGMRVMGALLSVVSSWVLADIIVFFWLRKVTGGISKLSVSYVKEATIYGIKAHLANIVGFLEYRLDMFLVNWFLNPSAVGFYSISVGLAEKLWLISKSAGVVLFPKVSAETDEVRLNKFTPLVARTVFWMTVPAALLLFFLTRYVIVLFYSETFLPAVRPLQILLPGIIALSVWRLLANDLAGRGKPMLNTYITGVSVVVNVVLNVLCIPKYGIAGASWASTVSYGLALVLILVVYGRLSGNHWTKVLLPQRGDGAIYRRTGAALGQWVKDKF